MPQAELRSAEQIQPVDRLAAVLRGAQAYEELRLR
jgi:hypothetical protein